MEETETPKETPKEGGTMKSALKGMFSFFTMLPINIEMKEMKAMDHNFWLVPVIGLFYGVLSLAIYSLLYWIIGSTFVSAVAALFCVHMFNRFLHLDGMIDIGDGLTVAGTREDHLRALKDTRIGAGGMATGLFVVLITVACYSFSVPYVMFFLIPMAEIMARNAQVSAAAFGMPGQGMAGNSVRYTEPFDLLGSSGLSVIFSVIMMVIVSLICDVQIYMALWIALIVSFIVSIVWGFIMVIIAEKNFGMVNGDVLGATNESSRALILVIALAVVMSL